MAVAAKLWLRAPPRLHQWKKTPVRRRANEGASSRPLPRPVSHPSIAHDTMLAEVSLRYASVPKHAVSNAGYDSRCLIAQAASPEPDALALVPPVVLKPRGADCFDHLEANPERSARFGAVLDKLESECGLGSRLIIHAQPRTLASSFTHNRAHPHSLDMRRRAGTTACASVCINTTPQHTRCTQPANDSRVS